MELTIKTVYVNANGTVSLLCPKCGDVEKKEAVAYKDFRKPVDIQCKCGNIYRVKVDFRSEYRKKINLEGMYFTDTKPEFWGKIIIKDATLQGCKFETKQNNPLRLNEEVRIEFRLNNDKKSLIRKRVIVRSKNSNFIGCQFRQLPNTFDPDLGFYLRQL